jgi:hypothetical protein
MRMGKDELRRNMGAVALQMMNITAQGIQYGWSTEFSYSEIKERYEDIKSQLGDLLGDITELSGEELNILGFKLWDEESGVYLAPLWAYDLIPDGTVLTSIDGDTLVKGEDDIDFDVRFGCLAYGIKR